MQIRYTLAIAFFISFLGGILWGYNTDVISGAILFISKRYHLASSQAETLVGAATWSALAAAMVCGWMLDQFGRKKILILSALLMLIGPLFDQAEEYFWALDIGRYIVGIGFGINAIAIPLYLTEVAYPKYRGALIALYPCAVTIGALLSDLTDLWLAKSENFYLMLSLSAPLSLLQMIGIVFLPESPAWLALKGYTEKANQIAAKLGLPLKNIYVSHQASSWKELFSTAARFSLVVGIVLAAIEQATGINSIYYYAPIILEKAGLNNAAIALKETSIITAAGIIMSFTCVTLVDKIGRKKLLQFGLILMSTSLILISAATFFFHHTVHGSWIVMILLIIYNASFDLSVGTVIWVLLPEVFQSKYRAKGVSFAVLINGLISALVTQTYLSIVGFLTLPGSFLIFAFFSIASYHFVKRYLEETKGKEI